MTKLPDAVPVSPEQAHVWAEGLIGDLTYEDALDVAQDPARDDHRIVPSPLADQRSKRPSAARRPRERG